MQQEFFKYHVKDKKLVEFLIKNLTPSEFCKLLKESENYRKTPTARLNWIKKKMNSNNKKNE